MHFDGSGDYLVVSDTLKLLALTYDESSTIECWVRFNSLPASKIDIISRTILELRKNLRESKKYDPKIVHLVRVLFVASFLNCIVDVPVVAEAVVFENVNAFPPVFKPSIVTLL